MNSRLMTVLILMIAATQIGCGPYYPYYEDAWVVEEEVVVEEPLQYYGQEKLSFKVSWDNQMGSPDLDVTLVTPFYHFVALGSFPKDGCLFTTMGSDNLGGRYSIIECDTPIHGHYDVQIENNGAFDVDASIQVTEQICDYGGTRTHSSRQNMIVNGHDTALVSYEY